MRLLLLCVLAASAMLVSPSVQARPRDDAMAGAFRCAIVSESRLWLDCYYGAAQPVRAQLKLPPAPDGQARLAFSPPAGGEPHDAGIRDQIMAEASRCLSFSGDRQWLDCYYVAALPMRVHLGLSAPQSRPIPPPPPMIATVRPATPTGLPPMPRNGGLLNGVFNDPRPVVHGVAMQSYNLNRKGAFTAVLADGQVWTQSEEDAIYHPARWRKIGPNTLVTITPGPMNTFVMKVAGEDRLYKVHRKR